MQKNRYCVLTVIITLWSLYHAAFLHLNEVLKVADSFAYIQMSKSIWELSQLGLGSGWFGFLYSLPIALFQVFWDNLFLIAKLVNILLFAISSILLWHIAKKVLNDSYAYLVLIIFYLSPTLLHFNIHVLSENIYIPLFLWLFLWTINFAAKIKQWTDCKSLVVSTIFISIMIGLMYLTRAEAFIYILSIWIIACTLLIQKHLNVWNFLKLWSVFFASFFIFIFPYLYHLHTLTWEWWLTNKWASNLRQAQMRWVDKMDDSWFEKAVGALTEDKSQLIAWFAGWMAYIKPQIEWNLAEYISHDPGLFLKRITINQRKLFSRNIPEIFLWKSPNLYLSQDTRFSHIFFLIFATFPLIILLFWIYRLYKNERDFFFISLSFFIPACIFFTLFFTLNRYFLVFLPLMIIAFSYWVQEIRIQSYWPIIRGILIINIVWVLLLSTSVYYNTEKAKDEYYSIKKTAGEWIKNNINSHSELKIMERFPIVTYYSGSQQRFITPYTNQIQDIYEYGNINSIDILVADSLDFLTYRPDLSEILYQTPDNFNILKEFTNQRGQKVILYQLKK